MRHLILLLLFALVSCCRAQDYLTINAVCYPDSDEILVTLKTSEPFEGLFYSRNHPSTCRVSGARTAETPLLVSGADRCGVRVVTARGEQGAREVDLYVQHDSIFQQVIDEQFQVQCLPGRPEGIVSYLNRKKGSGHGNRFSSGESYTRDVTVTSKFVGRRYRNDDSGKQFRRQSFEAEETKVEKKEQTQLETKEETIVANLVDSNLDVIAESPNWVEKNVNSEEEVDLTNLFRSASASAHSQRSRANSGWMEITWDDEDGDDELTAGTNVSLDIRLKQSGDHDTMLSTCLAFAGDHDNEMIQDLTDFRGCSLDTGVMEHFSASFNSRTGVKHLRSSFPVFKFPAQKELNLKCSVLVCKNNCPLTKCSDVRAEEPFPDVTIIDKFILETRVLVEDGVIAAPGSRRKSKFSKLTREELEEVEEALIEQQELMVDVTAVSEDDQLLCLSPSRIILAFGVILFILLLALVFACMLWMRARSQQARRQGGAGRQQGKVVHAPPMMARGPPGGVVGAPPPPMRRGYMMPRVNMPYIRVMQ